MDTIVGTRLGAYLVEKRLGQGGMATVFLGVQPSTGRKVAIKTLPKSQLSDPKAVARFEREARVLASLQHPHVLPLIDYGEMGDYKFLVVPYLAHGDLEDRLQRVLGPLDLAESRRLLTQLAEALDHAHSQGVVHRDLKPGNVLLDAQGNAMLADFGIAHQEGSDRLTGVGFTVGTPEYMAPEQVNGQPEARSDLYALGVLAFRLLTGMLPFKGANPTATLLLQRDAPPPDARSLAPALSAEIAAFLVRALAKDLQERFQTGAQFAQAVRAVLPEQSTTAQESTQQVSRPPLQAAQDASTQPHATPLPLATQPPVSAGFETLLGAITRDRDLPAPPAPARSLAELAAQALRGPVSGTDHATVLRAAVLPPAPPVAASPSAAVEPVVAAAPSARRALVWLSVLLLVAAAAVAAWWLLRPKPTPEIRLPPALPAPAAAPRPAAPNSTSTLFDDFSAGLAQERWQAVGGLRTRVEQGRLRLDADAPQQWLRARALAAISGASVRVQLAPSTRVATEAAAGLTVNRGTWWLSCYVYRYADSGQLEPRCMENESVVFSGNVLADEPHVLELARLPDGHYRFQLDGQPQTRIQPRNQPVEPLALVLSLWTPKAGAPVSAEFDDVRLVPAP